MRITRAIIKSFRSFGHDPVEIEFPDLRAPISIIGQNNSGKSNLIDALLFGLAARNPTPSAFSVEDFFMCETAEPALIEIHIDPPLRTADAFGRVTEMPILKLEISAVDGVIEVSHRCCDAQGKRVYTPQTIRRGKGAERTPEEREVLAARARTGDEVVYRHRSKIPVYYLSPSTFLRELNVNRFSLLGKVIEDIKAEFVSDTSLVEDMPGVVRNHVGRPRLKVYEQAISYLERFVLPTNKFRSVVSRVEAVLKEQLELDGDAISVSMGPPSWDSFFKELRFSVTDAPGRPHLPLERMGTGFTSMFVVALLQALVDTARGGSIFIIEEPETYLHEHFQEYAYNVLSKLALTNQVIYTTHSKKFVNIFEPASILRLHNRDHAGTLVLKEEDEAVAYPEEIDGLRLRSPDDFPHYMRTLEPNLGNVAFARKVLIVEGPHDLLAYRTAFERYVRFGLRNIAVVAAWGKDSLLSLVKLCRRLAIPYFVIHDWDLPSEDVDLSNDLAYAQLDAVAKAQFTKNRRILAAAGADRVHANKPSLEGVLHIREEEKSAASIFLALHGKPLAEIWSTYPGFLSPGILDFLEVDAQVLTRQPRAVAVAEHKGARAVDKRSPDD